MRTAVFTGFLVSAAIVTAMPAMAQLGSNINRPSNGPSQRVGMLGRVGGGVTGGAETYDPFSQVRSSTSAANASFGGTTTFGRGLRGFQRGARDPSYTALQPSEMGQTWGTVRSRPVNRLFRTMPGEQAVRAYSDFDSTTSFTRGAGVPLQTAPIRTRSYLPNPVGSTYHDFFGIVPADSEPVVEQGPPANFDPLAKPDSLADRAQEHMAEAGRAERVVGIQAFRDATGPGVLAERMERLDTAVELLDKARRRDADDYISRLLLAHLAFERSQVAYGLECLAEAVRSNPEIFVNKVDVGQYFGDRGVYERQLRRYIQAGTQSNAPPESVILEAYCAFMLGDTARAAAAAERAQKMATERSYSIPLPRDDVGMIAFAIKAATAR